MKNRAQALYDQARLIPDKTAVIFEDCIWTFAQLCDQTRSYAAGLAEAGIKRNDKVALMLSTRPDFITIEHAIYVLGATLVPLNTLYNGSEVIQAMQTCEVDCLLIDADFAARLPADFAAQCPSLKNVHVFGMQGFDALPGTCDAAGLSGNAADAPTLVELNRDDVPMMLYTSATTGKAKGVMITANNLESNYDATPGVLQLSTDEVILCALPFYNTFGLNQCINALITLGATMVLLPRFNAEACLLAIQKYRCTFLPAVPTMLQKMLYHPDAGKYDLSSLKRFCVGAAPVPAPLLTRLRERVGQDALVLNGYGLTEATAMVAIHEVVMDADGQLLRGKSIGRPIAGVEMAIMNSEGQALPPGAVGEICIKGPNVMKGYYKLPDATAEAIVAGWLYTGDIGSRDEDGYYTIVDRKKDVIIRGGQNIYPADIEEVLYHHPAVAEAAVIAQMDEVLGEVPKAFVSLKPGALVSPDELIDHCKIKLAYYKVPAVVEILPDLPKGPTGKILRRALRANPRGEAAL
jgi:long-chain acyl-CoA synthetase